MWLPRLMRAATAQQEMQSSRGLGLFFNFQGVVFSNCRNTFQRSIQCNAGHFLCDQFGRCVIKIFLLFSFFFSCYFFQLFLIVQYSQSSVLPLQRFFLVGPLPQNIPCDVTGMERERLTAYTLPAFRMAPPTNYNVFRHFFVFFGWCCVSAFGAFILLLGIFFSFLALLHFLCCSSPEVHSNFFLAIFTLISLGNNSLS